MPRETASSIQDAAGTDGGLRQHGLSVLIPLPPFRPYDYLAPEDGALGSIAPGDFVVVPLGRRQVTGVVWGAAEGGVAPEKLKPIAARLDLPPLPDISRRFIAWVAHYCMAPPGAVLRMAMSVSEALAPGVPLKAWSLGAAFSGNLTAARKRILDALTRQSGLSTADLARAADVTPGVIKAMATSGAIIAVTRAQPLPTFAVPDALRPGPALSPPQRAAADALAALFKERGRDGPMPPVLLDGVTGSGKTEVYFEAIAACLQAGRQALVLLPEITLSAQWLTRFEARFGVRPVVWHSELTPRVRREAWRAALDGRAFVVVGARSALFLPFRDLGLIIVDEEHDASFKQEEGVIYQARDMAVVRGHLAHIPVVLASATPSLETLHNAETGRYSRLLLPDRHGGAQLPHVSLIDLRRDRLLRQSWLSPRLRDAVQETLAAGEQALLFLNRRGYAPLTLCRACGHRLQCPHCTAWLVEHRQARHLLCHHCGYRSALSQSCAACGAEGSFAACGPGVERLQEEAAATFPEARLLVLTSDTINGPGQAAARIEQIQDHAVDLVIGTQIIAKGHHFPQLTLVGVVDADLGLHGGDLRATERTFQLLYQVAGRAGRGARPGRVLIQTYDPARPLMQALQAGDRDQFFALEASERVQAGMPPFGRLAALILSGPDSVALDQFAAQLARKAPRIEGVTILGPAPAPLALLRGRHRRRFLLKSRRDVPLQPVLRAWLEGMRPVHGLRWQIDIDPYSFF